MIKKIRETFYNKTGLGVTLKRFFIFFLGVKILRLLQFAAEV